MGARASGLIARSPKGYDTPVRRGGRLFSGGERQRLGLARAILRDGRIWLLDESTTGLDARSAAELTDTLIAATEGRTVVWVTHDPDVAARMDSVLELDAGRVTFSGPAAEYGRRQARAG